MVHVHTCITVLLPATRVPPKVVRRSVHVCTTFKHTVPSTVRGTCTLNVCSTCVPGMY
jgi:hypothetical protein